MVIKVYISSVTCNNQQRKNQHTILSKLQAEKVDFIKIDVTDPKHNQEKQHMRELSKSRKEGTFAVPPQIFNDSEYCGDYEAFADALETQNLWEFLKMKELQDQLKQKIEDDDSLIGFNKEGEEEKKDEEGGEKTKEAIIEEEEEEKVVEEAKEGDEEEKKEEKEEDTKETEADEKTDEEVEKKEEVFADNEQLETQVEESEGTKNAEPSKISEELARNLFTEVEEYVIKKELPNTLRSLRRIIVTEESLAQKYAGPMEQENESKEEKEPLEQELLEEVIEEILQCSSVKSKQAMKDVETEEIQYLIRKEGEKETEKGIVNDVCPESVQNINKNREDKEENKEFQNLSERLNEASGVVDYTEDLKDERKDIENIGILDEDKREVNEYTEFLVDKEFSEDTEPHNDDTNDNVELFEEKVKDYISIGEREFTENSNLLVEKSDVEDEITTTDPITDEEKDITECSNNSRDGNIYEDRQEDGEMEDIRDDDDKENNQSLRHSEHLDEEYAEDFEEEMVKLQDESDKEQIEKDEVPRDTEYLEKEGEFSDSSLSEVLHTDLARNDGVDNIEDNEEFAQLVPTNSEEGQEQYKKDMELLESVELETDKFSKENLSEAKESEESEQKTEIEEKVDKAEVEEEKKTEESETQE